MQPGDQYCGRQVKHIAEFATEQIGSLWDFGSYHRSHEEDRNQLAALTDLLRVRVETAAQLIEKARYEGAFSKQCDSALSAVRSEIRDCSQLATDLLKQDATTAAATAEAQVKHSLRQLRIKLKWLLQQAEPGLDGSNATLGFSILVISDLHHGLPDQVRSWVTTHDALLRGLDSDLRGVHPIKLVIFAGDLAFDGRGERYQAVNEFLGNLWSTFRAHGTNPWLLAVPGNHDINRSSLTSEAKALFRSLAQDRASEDHFWREKDCDMRKYVRTAFTAFEAWQNNNQNFQKSEQDRNEKSATLLEKRTGQLPGEASYRLLIDGMRVGAVCLNSAVSHISPRSEGNDEWPFRKCVLNSSQVTSCIDQNWSHNNDLNILITHHPFSWFKEDSLKEFRDSVILNYGFNLFIHGHMHEPDAHYTGGSHANLELHYQSPALFASDEWSKPGTDSVHRRIRGYCLIDVARQTSEFLVRAKMRILEQGRVVGADHLMRWVQDDGWTDYHEIRRS